MSWPFLLVASTLLFFAAWRDIATRLIPDTISVLLVTAGGFSRVVDGPWAIASSMAVAVGLLTLLFLAHSRGLIGGGDVKLMTALAVGLSPLDSYRFVVATAIAGGVLAVAYLLLSRRLRGRFASKPMSSLGRVVAAESWRIRRHGPLPYGVAIAAGGAFVLLYPGSL